MSFDPALTDPGTWSARLREVESRVRAHEDVCEERESRRRDEYRGLRETITHNSKEFGKRVDDIQHLLIKIALMLLGGMASILAAIVWLR